MHADEAVHAAKLGTLLEQGRYAYDPEEFHGPTLNYLTLLPARLQGAVRYADLDERTLRSVPAAMGVLLVAAHALLIPLIGVPAAAAAALLTALSPAMVFYSRYYIQETLLVFFSFGALISVCRYLLRPGARLGDRCRRIRRTDARHERDIRHRVGLPAGVAVSDPGVRRMARHSRRTATEAMALAASAGGRPDGHAGFGSVLLFVSQPSPWGRRLRHGLSDLSRAGGFQLLAHASLALLLRPPPLFPYGWRSCLDRGSYCRFGSRWVSRRSDAEPAFPGWTGGCCVFWASIPC